MRKLGLFVFVLAFACAAFAQEVLYEEHFAEGEITLDWFTPWGDEAENIEAVPDESAPDDDDWVGSIDTGGMVGTALAGDLEDADYKVEAWVYCTVNESIRNGIVARWDTTGGMAGNSYYYLYANFSTVTMPPSLPKLQLRKYPGETGTGEDILTWNDDTLPGGIPTESDWHKMALECTGDTLRAYWDDELLPNCPVTDEDQTNGFFGIYSFRMGEAAVTLADAIVVTGEVEAAPSISVDLDTLDFGEVGTDDSEDLSLVISNEGSLDLTVSGIVAEGDYFSVDFEPQVVIEPDSSYSVTVTFAPEAEGEFDGTLTITSDDPENEEVSVFLTGIGSLAKVGNETYAHPSGVKLHAIYPNPFNSTTNIGFELANSTSVTLQIFNINGGLVRTVVNGELSAGSHSYSWDSGDIATGIYFVRFEGSGFKAIRKVILVR